MTGKALISILGATVLTGGCAMNTAYDVTGKRELFVDDFLIEKSSNVAIRQHEPVELPGDPGKKLGHYSTILKNPDGSYFLYYRGLDSVYKGSQYNNNPGEFFGLVRSADGVKWEKSNWKRFPGKPVPGDAIIYGKEIVTHNFAPFYDTAPECKVAERYKAVAGVRETKGLFAYYSADGINWKPYSDKPVMAYEPEKNGGHMFDSLNVLFYSPVEKCYVMYIRVWKTADGLTGLRSFAKVTSKDFIHWSEPEYLKVNRKDEHIYASCLTPYERAPHYYVGAATRYFEKRGSATDVVLLFSRNGQGIIRPSFEAWIRPGLDPERWLNRMNYITWGIIQETPETLLLYHNRKPLMYRLRTDGFTSLYAGVEEGTVLSRVLERKNCGDVELNLSTSAGGAFSMEICDENGKVLPGYSFADMTEFFGDKISFVPEWNGKKLSDLPAGKFRFRIKMSECDLYSIKFTEE